MQLSQRRFVQITTSTLTVLHLGHPGKAENGFAPMLNYPATRLAALKDLKVGKPLVMQYPDKDSQAYLLKLGQKAHSGVGPDRDVVAFSATCTHKGCPVDFKQGRFVCPCLILPRTARCTRGWPAPSCRKFRCRCAKRTCTPWQSMASSGVGPATW